MISRVVLRNHDENNSQTHTNTLRFIQINKKQNRIEALSQIRISSIL